MLLIIVRIHRTYYISLRWKICQSDQTRRKKGSIIIGGNPLFPIRVVFLYSGRGERRCDADAFINRIVQTELLLSLVSGQAQRVKHRGRTRQAAHVKLPRLFALPIFVAVWYIKSPSSGHCRKIWQRSAVFCAAALAAPQIESLEKTNASIVYREESCRMCCVRRACRRPSFRQISLPSELSFLPPTGIMENRASRDVSAIPSNCRRRGEGSVQKDRPVNRLN